MPITVQRIDIDQRDRVLELPEGHFCDLKAIEISPSKLTKTISSFANTDGGELYVGIDEIDRATHVRAWRGFPNEEAANGHLQIFEQLFPLGQDFEYIFLSCDGESGLVLQVLVHKTAAIVKASDGLPYIRRGAQKLPVNTLEATRRLEYGKGLTSFESECVNCSAAEITNSEVTLGFILDVVPSVEPERWLKKQRLTRDDKPTVAGLVLFSEEPQAVLPKRCGIKVYRYKTSELQGTRDTLASDPYTVEGCAYTQIREAVKLTAGIVESITKLGPDGFEEVIYPPEAIHEIITNAVLHRDYSIADDIHIRVFDNRIEIESPGKLPAHINVGNILDERFARNGTIVRIINKFPDPPNKDVGEGLNTAFDAMRRLKLKDPEIEQRENSVIVYIRHESLASPEQLIMEYLETHNEINNSRARDICHIGSENRVKRIFQRLMASDQIERIPELKGANTAYRKKTK